MADWNLVDGEPDRCRSTPTPSASQLLDDFSRAAPVADAADDLYMAAVLGPLVSRAQAVIAHYIDQRIDISHPQWQVEAPEAVEAILDYHYPDGRHRDDFGVARWRLQLLAEAGFGWRIRGQGR